MNGFLKLFAPAILGCILLTAPGCYTQIATMDEEPYDEEYSESIDSLPADDTTAIDETFSDETERPYSIPWWEFDYYYPISRPLVIYDPWPYYDMTVIYPHPWWWNWPYYGYWGYHTWYGGGRHVWYGSYGGYGQYDYSFGSSGVTRNSGTRRSGNDRRRDYESERGSSASSAARPGVVRSDGGTQAAPERGSTPVAGRSRSTTTSQQPRSTPASRGSSRATARPTRREWSLPSIFDRPSRSSSSSSGSGTRSSSPESSSRPQSASQPAPSAPSHSSPPPSSSGRSGGSETRSSGSSRPRGR